MVISTGRPSDRPAPIAASLYCAALESPTSTIGPPPALSAPPKPHASGFAAGGPPDVASVMQST